MQAKLRDASNRSIGAITGKNLTAIVQRARREAQRYGLRRLRCPSASLSPS